MEKLSKDNINQFKRLVKEVVQETVVKNPFKVGDLVKLRPDILKRISLGPNRNCQNWYRTLANLQDKMGKITKVFPSNKNVNVEYKESWVSKDDWNRGLRINSIGIDSEELVPYSEDPSIGEGVGWVHTKNIKRDPHHTTNKMTGKVNRWTIKYEGVNKEKNISPIEMAQKLFDSLRYWDFINAIREEEFDVSNAAKRAVTKAAAKKISSEGPIGNPTIVSYWHWIKSFLNSKQRKIYNTLYDMCVKEISSIMSEKRIQRESTVSELRDLGKVDEISENPNKNYIIFARSGPQSVYYCKSSTRGDRLLPYSQDIAVRFKTKEEVYKKIHELKQKYKGILKWDYEVVPAEQSEFEKTYTATV